MYYVQKLFQQLVYDTILYYLCGLMQKVCAF